MVESLDTVPNCVKKKMTEIAREKGDSFTKEEQKKALGKAFGMCRTTEQDFLSISVKIQNKILKAQLNQIREDVSILSKSIAKTKENKQRSIFFRPYRPLETLNEVTKTSGKNTSSNIAGMEYSEGMLKVNFNWEGKGEVEYGYDVGPDFYDRMAKSQSKGKFLWSELRGKTPGYVIDNPRKMTPGGVGGSIVPYTKITKRAIQGDEFKRLQKHYAGQLKGKVKVVAHMPFVRAKQKLISRESKGFGKSPSLDFVWIKVAALSDNIPIKGHMRAGKWVEAYERKGDKAEELKKKIRERGIEKTPLPKPEIKGEKKAQKREPKEISEEKRRKILDKQISRMKAVTAPEPREAAIQKLIEETGMGRKQAEERIAKVMGVSPEVAKKKAEVKEHEIKFKAQNKELSVKLVALNQINAKVNSVALGNIVKLFLKAFTLLATKKDPVAVLKNFSSYYNSLKRDKNMVIKQRKELITQIGKIHKELIALSKKKADFSVKAHFRKGKPVVQHEKIDKKKQKSYGKIEYKYLKKRVGELGKTLKSLKKKMDAGDEEAKKNYYVLLKYKNKLEDDKSKAEGRKLFGDFEYISAAVDQCAKRAIARAGGKGSYSTEVANCIRVIGIRRRQAGLAPRPQGTQREERRAARRERRPAVAIVHHRRVGERSIALRERTEAEARRQVEAERVRRERASNEESERVVRLNLRDVTTQLSRGNLRMAEESLRMAEYAINDIENNDNLKTELESLYNIANMNVEAYREGLLERQRERAARQQQQEALSTLRRYQTRVQRYMLEPDFPAVETAINLARRELEKLIDNNVIGLWQGAVSRWQEELTAAQEAHHQRYTVGTERIREILESREERLAREARERVRAGVRELRQRRLEESGRLNAESSVSGLNESEGGVMHIETSAEELGRIRTLRDPPERYYISPTETRPMPEGMEVRRSGGLVNYPSGRIGWRRTTFQPAGTRASGRPTRRRPTPSGPPSEGLREQSRQNIERRRARRAAERLQGPRPPKVQWKMTIRGTYADGSRINIENFKRNKWREGSSIIMKVFHPDGREAGYATFDHQMVRDERGGRHLGTYLNYLVFQPWASGETQGQARQFRNAPIKEIGAQIVSWVDKHKLWVEGQATPIGVARGSVAAQRLFNFYRSFGARPYSEREASYGHTGAGFYREPIGQWADLVMKIRIKNFEDVFPYTDGHIYYYDKEKDMIYRLEFNVANKIKSKIQGEK